MRYVPFMLGVTPLLAPDTVREYPWWPGVYLYLGVLDVTVWTTFTLVVFHGENYWFTKLVFTCAALAAMLRELNSQWYIAGRELRAHGKILSTGSLVLYLSGTFNGRLAACVVLLSMHYVLGIPEWIAFTPMVRTFF